MRNRLAKQRAQRSLLLSVMVCSTALLTLSLVSGCSTMTFSHAMQKPLSQASPAATTPHALPSPTPSPEHSQFPARQNKSATPLRLLIPSIQVNALIESVGVLASGDLATPTQDPWNDAGWYKAGPRPGEPGSAVLDGHLDRPGGAPAVFWNLQYMHIGETITVVKSQGASVQFHVTAIARYAPQAAPLQDIFGNTSGTFLNLITCAGDWIPSQHQTTQRLVVYTTRS